MPKMTEEEAWTLAEEVEKNPPKVSGDGKSGFFMKHKNEIVILDNVSATWLRLKSEATQKSTSEIIGELVREKIIKEVDTAEARSIYREAVSN